MMIIICIQRRRRVRRHRRNPSITKLDFRSREMNSLFSLSEFRGKIVLREARMRRVSDGSLTLQGAPVTEKTGIDFEACLKLTGNGSQRRCFAWQTLSTKSQMRPVALMKGRPRIRFTTTSGPVATRRDVSLLSLVR